MPPAPKLFLLTRFNIPVQFAGSENRLRPDWLQRRFELFERFCLPSVAAQTTREFEWLILLDSETPAQFKERMDSHRRHAWVRPLYVGHSWRNALRMEISGRLRAGAAYVLTSRLDSDDAIASDFIESAMAAADARGPGVFVFPRGYVWHQGRVYLRDYPANPFATLSEPAAEFQTVFQATHDSLSEVADVHFISERPAWLQVVHGGNASNSVTGLRLWSSGRLRGLFPPAVVEIPVREGLLDWAVDFVRSARYWRGALGPVRRTLARFLRQSPQRQSAK